MWVSLLSDMSSGIIGTALLQPLDVAKTSLINPVSAKLGMLSLFRTIVRDEGVWRLWKTRAGTCPHLARLRLLLATQTALLARIRGDREKRSLSNAEVMTVGIQRAAVALCCPISVVKTRVEGTGGRSYRTRYKV